MVNCPFCGSIMTLEEYPGYNRGDDDILYWECDFCDAMLPDEEEEDD